MSLKATLQGFVGGFTDFLFPKSLEVYKLESYSPSELVQKLPGATDLGEDTLAVFSYADPQVRDLVWELKYRKNVEIASSLAVVLYDVLCHELGERAVFDNFSAPLLIPMPMSSKRRADRGWNQTEILSEELVKLDTNKIFEYSRDILSKSRHTGSQTLTANKKMRLRNLENTMRAESVVGRNIILLDDVTTTGATFAEARSALKLAGAKKILCVALAH